MTAPMGRMTTGRGPRPASMCRRRSCGARCGQGANRAEMASPPNFGQGPPIALESNDWATDFNEIKDYGGQKSAKRTEQQTETARFWLVTGSVAYHPFLRQLATAKQMGV